MSDEVWGMHLSGDGKLTKEEREKLIFKLTRMCTFIGCEIPEKVELEGEIIPLHEFMWRLITTKGPLTPEEFAAVDLLHYKIEKKIREEESEIKSADITEEEALKLYVEACGLIRAAVELRDIEKTGMLHDYSHIAVSEKVDAQKRWLEFLRKIK